MKMETGKSLRCMVRCKDCKNSKRVSYYVTRCNVSGRRVGRNKYIYCDVFRPTTKATREVAKDVGVKVTPIGAWVKGVALPRGVRSK